jgi:hypothetical protein
MILQLKLAKLNWLQKQDTVVAAVHFAFVHKTVPLLLLLVALYLPNWLGNITDVSNICWLRDIVPEILQHLL